MVVVLAHEVSIKPFHQLLIDHLYCNPKETEEESTQKEFEYFFASRPQFVIIAPPPCGNNKN